jgi:hypothetical protein
VQEAAVKQLTFDDCTPDWPVPDPLPRLRPVGTRYHLRPQDDLRSQHLRTSRIVTIPIRGEYL